MLSIPHSGTVSLGKHLKAQGFHVLAGHVFPGAPNLQRIIDEKDRQLYVPVRDPMLSRISWENNPVPGISRENPVTVENIETLIQIANEEGAILVDIRELDQVENASEDVTGLKARYLAGGIVLPEFWEALAASEPVRAMFEGWRLPWL